MQPELGAQLTEEPSRRPVGVQLKIAGNTVGYFVPRFVRRVLLINQEPEQTIRSTTPLQRCSMHAKSSLKWLAVQPSYMIWARGLVQPLYQSRERAMLSSWAASCFRATITVRALCLAAFLQCGEKRTPQAAEMAKVSDNICTQPGSARTSHWRSCVCKGDTKPNSFSLFFCSQNWFWRARKKRQRKWLLNLFWLEGSGTIFFFFPKGGVKTFNLEPLAADKTPLGVSCFQPARTRSASPSPPVQNIIPPEPRRISLQRRSKERKVFPSEK